MLKVLIENPLMTSVELKEYLELSWNEFQNHMKALKRMNYLTIEEKFIDGSAKKVIIVEPFGVNEFNNLSSLLIKFFHTSDADEYIKLITEITEEE